jgi:PPK2 family polyphosphate:nucleotide phosphotransferase
MNFTKLLRVKPDKKLRLSKRDPSDTAGLQDKDAAVERLAKNVRRLSELQYLLYAENRRSVLVVLQAMDAGGKDGVVRHVFSGINPQGCRVTSFKAPTGEELEHDFLWRINRALPRKGEIGLFNRSHYEDVLIVRVHNLVPKSVWSQRYDQINAFEQTLAENGVMVLKFFLHISKKEQLDRLQSRLEKPHKRWKVNPSDFVERKFWDDYQEAYEEALMRCSKPWAPWFIIPANKKWFRNLAVSEILIETLEKEGMKFPQPAYDLAKIKVK